jgi:hypothetical protein
LFRDSISRAKFYGLAFDKGDKSNGKYGGCVKLISYVDEYAKGLSYPDGQIQTMTLDADKTGDDSIDVASGVKYSVDKLALPPGTAGVAATTDSGGGGTLLSVHAPLIESDVLMGDALLLNCTLHNLNVEGAVAFKKILMGINSGGGDKDKHAHRDLEQLLNSAFRFEDFLDREVRVALWSAIRDYNIDAVFVADCEGGVEATHEQYLIVKIFDNIDGSRYICSKRGSDGRWWSIGEAADLLYKTIPIRKGMAENLDKLKKNGAARDTAQTLLSLLKEQTIICDLALVKCHHRFYLARHCSISNDPIL